MFTEGRHLQTVTQRLEIQAVAEREAAVSALAAGGTGGLFFWVSPGCECLFGWLHTPGRVWGSKLDGWVRHYKEGNMVVPHQ